MGKERRRGNLPFSKEGDDDVLCIGNVWGEEGACLLPERDSETRIESGGGKVSFRFLAWCLFEKDLDAGSGVRNLILIHPQSSKYP